MTYTYEKKNQLYHLFGFETGNPPNGFAEHYWGGGLTPNEALDIIHERQLDKAELVCEFGLELDSVASYDSAKDGWQWVQFTARHKLLPGKTVIQ